MSKVTELPVVEYETVARPVRRLRGLVPRPRLGTFIVAPSAHAAIPQLGGHEPALLEQALARLVCDN